MSAPMGVAGLVLALAVGARADTIELAGSGNGFDEEGANAVSFRTLGVTKSFDLNGDDVYGSHGYFFFGIGGGVNINGQPFSRHTEDAPSWVSVFSPGANFASVAEYNTYTAIDDPTALVTSNTVDWIRSGIGVATGSGVGTWTELLTFAADSSAPTNFRVGIMTGNEGSNDGRWSPTGLRLSVDGGAAVAVTNLPDLDTTSIGMVFFDVTTDGTGSTFSVEGQQRLATQGSSMTGVTFDEPSAVYWPGARLELGQATLSLDLYYPDTSTNGTIDALYVMGTASNDIEIVSLEADAGFSASVVSNTLGAANPDEAITVTFTNSVGLENGDTTNSTLVVSWTGVGSGVTNTANAALDVTCYAPTPLTDLIVGYDALDANLSSTSAATTNAPGVTASDIMGSGAAFVVVAASGDNTGLDADGNIFGTGGELGSWTAGNVGLQQTTHANAIAQNDYFSFTITPDSGNALDLDSISFKASNKNTSPDPAEWFAVHSSVDGFTNTASAIATGEVTHDGPPASAYQGFSFALSDDGYRNIASEIEFRVYLWGGKAGGSSGSGRIYYDKLVVKGIIRSTGTLLLIR